MSCFQGVFSPGTFGQLELPGNWYGALEWQYPPHQRQGSYEEEGRAINTLKVSLSVLQDANDMSLVMACRMGTQRSLADAWGPGLCRVACRRRTGSWP